MCPARGEGEARVRLANIRANYWPGRDETLEGNSGPWKYQDPESPRGRQAKEEHKGKLGENT